MAYRGLLTIVLALQTSCAIDSRLVDCGNGTLCPVDTVCVPGGSCATPAEVAACAGRPDGETCQAERGAGVCVSEVCSTGQCGDLRVDALEICDDGNRASGDGCNGTCTSNETCGNGIVELAEACDDGVDNGGERCRADCVLPRCGNGEVDALEVCDDGNPIGGDGCAPSCASNETCGNGVTDFGLGEQCDDGNLVDHDGCQSTCVIQRCGDAITDAGEVCDDGNLASADGCSPDCLSDESCGNNILDFFAGERCDDGNQRSHDGCHSRCQLESAVWTQVGPETLPAHEYSMAYDAGRERLVAYVGFSNDGTSETYELLDTGWVRANPIVTPPARYAPGLAYDAARREIVMFGGVAAEGYTNETWTYNGSTWQLREPLLSPGARCCTAAAYDPIRQRVVVQGGASEIGTDGDTWEWDGTTWAQTEPDIVNLRGQAQCRMAYDVANNRIVRLSGTLWEYTNQAWTELTAIASVNASCLTYDVARAKLIALGGSTTYELDGTTWTPLSVGTSPGGFGSAVGYDARRREVVLHGSQTSSATWRYNAGAWTSVVPSPRPPALVGPGLAYDNVRDRLVLFGGTEYTGSAETQDTWEFDGARWTKVAATGPSGRYAPVMAYDVARKKVVMFGGQDSSYVKKNDTWEYDGTWTGPIVTANAPSGRFLSAMTYDPDTKQCLVAGGISTGPVPADLWGYNGTNWTLIPGATPPDGHYDHALAYDEANQRTILFGGYTNGPVGDTWAHDGDSWMQLGSPSSSLDFPAAAYLAVRKRVVRQGGYFNPRAHELDGAVWRSSAALPTDRNEHRLAGDPLRDRVLVYGGYAETGPPWDPNDLWAYHYRSDAPDEYCAGGGDRDGDGLAGCADPDCEAACSPMCPPLSVCPVGAVRCGDGTCGASESKRLCPADCGAIVPMCGDGWCDGPETATSCNADC